MSIRTVQNKNVPQGQPVPQDARPNHRRAWILGSAAAALGASALIAPHVDFGRGPAETHVCVKAQPSDGFQSVVDRAVSKEVATKQDPNLDQFGLSNPVNAQTMVDNVTSGPVQPGDAYAFTFKGGTVSAVAVGDPFSPACQA
jgi:hypothetical protein